MRWLLLALPFALPACSSDVAVADAADCATDVVSCRCPDGTESSHDVCLTEWCNCYGHEGTPDAGTTDVILDAAMDAAAADR